MNELRIVFSNIDKVPSAEIEKTAALLGIPLSSFTKISQNYSEHLATDLPSNDPALIIFLNHIATLVA